MRTEGRPLFGDLGQILETENLEPPGIGEDWPIPVHKLVQTAEAANEFVAGTDIEVVGVTEDDLRPDLDQILRCHRLDRTQGAHRHEDRRLHGAVQGRDFAAAGLAFR